MSACGPEGLVIDFGSQRTQRDEVVQVDEDCKINLPGGFNVGMAHGHCPALKAGAAGEDALPRDCDPEGQLSSEYRGYQP